MASANRTATFRHETLGEVTGLARGNDIVQFRGIPFATIPGRFRQSSLATSLPSSPFDATEPGPICPQNNLAYTQWWKGPLAEDGVELSQPEQDEFKCLNLNITVPQSALNKPRIASLPVLVFIHGGALIGGSQSIQVSGREIYDPYNLVKASTAMHKEIIVVTINYRLGPLGFLASSALKAFNQSCHESFGNYGLHDQRQALTWIFKFIRGFGGDPNNVTISGTSAGAVSCHYQAVLPQSQFQRAICASGSIPTGAALPLEHHEKYFEALTNALGKTSKRQDQVELLQSTPVMKLLATLPQPIVYLVVDGEWLSSSNLYELLSTVKSPPDIILGSCADENEFFESQLNPPNASQPLSDNENRTIFQTFLSGNGMFKSQSTTFPSSHPSVLRAYSLEDSPKSPGKQWQSWAQLLADCTFGVPAVYSAIAHLKTHPTSKVLLYDFQATNPYEELPFFTGKANHGVNDLYLFNVAEDLVPRTRRANWKASVAGVQAVWISLCHGEMPWKPLEEIGGKVLDLKQVGPVMVFRDGVQGDVADMLEEALTPGFAGRWTAVLGAAGGGGGHMGARSAQ